MSPVAVAAVQPPSYPARPLNGGPLELTPPKPGQWGYEPKYNGWRALVHAPTGSMFNRYGQPLSIAAEFGRALKRLRDVALPGDVGRSGKCDVVVVIEANQFAELQMASERCGLGRHSFH